MSTNTNNDSNTTEASGNPQTEEQKKQAAYLYATAPASARARAKKNGNVNVPILPEGGIPKRSYQRQIFDVQQSIQFQQAQAQKQHHQQHQQRQFDKQHHQQGFPLQATQSLPTQSLPIDPRMLVIGSDPDELQYKGRAKLEWDRMYECLEEYRNKSGDCYFLNPAQYPDGSVNQRLSTWVKNQRRVRKKLLRCQQTKLDKLNFDWSDQRTMAFRNRSPDKANEQYRQQWTGYLQRNQPRNNHDKWLFMFAKLNAFKEEFGHVDIPIRWKRDPALGKWVSRQRETRRNLKPEYFDKLQAIGFKWRLKLKGKGKYVDTNGNTSAGISDKYDVQWTFNYQQVLAYRNVHGHCRIPLGYGEDDTLSKWAHKQRLLFGRDELRADRVITLRASGFFDDVELKHKDNNRNGNATATEAFEAAIKATSIPTDAATMSATKKAKPKDAKAVVTPTPPRAHARTLPGINSANKKSAAAVTTAVKGRGVTLTGSAIRSVEETETVHEGEKMWWLKKMKAHTDAQAQKQALLQPAQQQQQQQQQPPWMMNLHNNTYNNTTATSEQQQQHQQTILNNANAVVHGPIPFLQQQQQQQHHQMMMNATFNMDGSVSMNGIGMNNRGGSNPTNGMVNNKRKVHLSGAGNLILHPNSRRNTTLGGLVYAAQGSTTGVKGQVPPSSPHAAKTGGMAPATTTAPAGKKVKVGISSPILPIAPDGGNRTDPFAVSSFNVPGGQSGANFLERSTPEETTTAPRKVLPQLPQFHSYNLYCAPRPQAELDSFTKDCSRQLQEASTSIMTPVWKRKRKWRLICS